MPQSPRARSLPQAAAAPRPAGARGPGGARRGAAAVSRLRLARAHLRHRPRLLAAHRGRRAGRASCATSCAASAGARCAGARIRARFYGAEHRGRDRPRRLFPRRDVAGRPGGPRARLAPARPRDAGAGEALRRGRGLYPARRRARRRRLRHRRHGDAHRRRQQGGDALAALRRGRRQPHRLSRRLRALPGAARRGRGRRDEPDALRLPGALGHLRDPRGVLPGARDPRRPDPLPARVGTELEAPAAPPRRGPQAPPDRGDDAPLRRDALRADRRQRPARPGNLPGDRRPPPGPRPRRLHPRHRRPRPRPRRRGHRHVPRAARRRASTSSSRRTAPPSPRTPPASGSSPPRRCRRWRPASRSASARREARDRTKRGTASLRSSPGARERGRRGAPGRTVALQFARACLAGASIAPARGRQARTNLSTDKSAK